MKNWPPLIFARNENQMDIKYYIKTLMEDNTCQFEVVNNWFDDLSREINNKINEKKKSILKQVEHSNYIKEQIINNYFQYSENLKMKQILESQQKITEKCKNMNTFLQSIFDQAQNKTLMLQNMISYYQFTCKQMFNTCSFEIKNSICKKIETIQFFDKSISEIELSQQKIQDLFSNQEDYDLLRQKIKQNYDYFSKHGEFPELQGNFVDIQRFNRFSPINKYNLCDIDQLETFTNGCQNQLSSEQGFVTDQKQNIFIQYNKQKVYDIHYQQDQFLNYSNIYSYFKNALKQTKKYIFRVRSQYFLSSNCHFTIGLIPDPQNMNFQQKINIKGNNNQINTEVEELQFEISISQNMFKVLSYPKNSLIYNYQQQMNQKLKQYFAISFDQNIGYSNIQVTYFQECDN
ncbi:hypothetical protein ABPG74_013159 [Tetrahymena malaccensis]